MTKKIIAVFTLTAMLFSLCSPIFADMREEKLNEREKLQTERALLLADQAINLDDKEQELNRRSAELEEMSKLLQSRNVDFSVREIELEEFKASLNKDSALLAAQNQELARNQEQFASYKAEVEQKALEAERKANEAVEKFKAAEASEMRTAQREKEIADREDEIKANLSQLEIKKADLLALEKKTNEDVQSANEKMALIEKQKEDLEAAQKILAEERSKLAENKNDLDALKADADKIVSEANALKAEADEKIRKADEILKLNDEQKTVIAKLEAELNEKNKTLEAIFMPGTFGDLFAELISDASVNSSITVMDSGVMNWSDGSIRAKGLGIAPESGNEAQGKALARRAAIVDLQRNLLETIQGVQIDSKTKMVNFMAEDEVNSAVQGTIKGVEVISENWDEKTKTYTVAGQVRQEKLSGAMSAIRKRVNLAKKLPKEPKKKTGKYTGLIIDVRHLPVEQQKIVRVVDEKGVIVYGPEYADKNVQDKNGLCAYFDKIVLAKDEEAKVGNNPLVIKAQRFASNGNDIVIPTSEANKIRSNSPDFRKDCKVIFVKS